MQWEGAYTKMVRMAVRMSDISIFNEKNNDFWMPCSTPHTFYFLHTHLFEAHYQKAMQNEQILSPTKNINLQLNG